MNPAYFFFGLAALLIYLLPIIVAYGKKNFASIAALNILLGWSFIGWAIALVWALKKD
jgi:hypothetical protein